MTLYQLFELSNRLDLFYWSQLNCKSDRLYTSMVRLLKNEPTSQSDLTKILQQDIQFVTEFIKENFEFQTCGNRSRPTSSNLTLKRVGQYLKFWRISIRHWINGCSTWRKDQTWHWLTKRLFLYGHNTETQYKRFVRSDWAVLFSSSSTFFKVSTSCKTTQVMIIRLSLKVITFSKPFSDSY
jgi:hypothetical protein